MHQSQVAYTPSALFSRSSLCLTTYTLHTLFMHLRRILMPPPSCLSIEQDIPDTYVINVRNVVISQALLW